MTPCSPGLLQGCFELLSIANHSPLTIPHLRSAFANLGSIPTSRIVEVAQVLGWIRTDGDGFLLLTASGSQLLNRCGYEAMLRKALLDYIEVERPAWLQNAISGRTRVLKFSGPDIAQVFVEAGLVHGTDAEVIEFWDDLAARARGQKNSALMSIGRDGERLTIAHEKNRTGRQPKWVSIDSNSDGYDILSVAASDDFQQLSIEVKASRMGMAGTFHLTRNEWEWADGNEFHQFHLWNIRDFKNAKLAVISADEMAMHIPTNIGSGSWELVEIPFATFSSKFEECIA